jgi:hypothetical protein
LSSLEVAQTHLRRIEQVNPHLNGVIQLAAEQALGTVRAAHAALANGHLVGPLHGYPCVVVRCGASPEDLNWQSLPRVFTAMIPGRAKTRAEIAKI